MLLENRKELYELENSIYKDDKLFKQIVEKLTPNVIYDLNQEIIDVFSDVIINFSPISINIIDYWNKESNCTSYINKQTVKDQTLEYDNFDVEIILNYEHYDTIINPNAVVNPSTPREHFLVPERDKYSGYFESSPDWGFHLNSTIKLQDTLANIFMNNVYKVADIAKQNTNLRSRLTDILRRMNMEETIMSNINELFTEERFVLNSDWRVKKGTEVALRYSAHQAIDSEVQPYIPNRRFRFDILYDAPFEYIVEGSLFPSVFEYFVKPLSHPIGYTYDYRCIIEPDGDFDYDNSGYQNGFIDYVLSKKVETCDYLIVNALCESNKSPCCPAPDYDDPTETFECVENSGGQYGRWFVISSDIDNDGSAQWSEITGSDPLNHVNNNLDYTETGIVQNGDYYGWRYYKYVYTNKNYLIKFQREADNNVTFRIVIEYHEYDILTDTYTIHSRWNNGWHANINKVGCRHYYESTISEEFTIEQGTDRILCFGFEDNPAITEHHYINLEGPNPADVVPLWWDYQNFSWDNIDCSQKPNFPNAGFAEFGFTVDPDPAGIAGIFCNSPIYKPWSHENAYVGALALYKDPNFRAIIYSVNDMWFGFEDNPYVTRLNYQSGEGPNPDDVIPLGYTYKSYDKNYGFAEHPPYVALDDIDPDEIAGKLR